MKHLTILVIILFAFAQCKKDDDTQYNVYFSTTDSVTDSTWTLYVDGDNKGLLINPTVDYSCSAPDSILSKYIYLQLPSGKYQLEAKDENGTVKSSGFLELKKDEVSGGGGTGGMQVQPSGDCVVVKFFDHL